MSTVPPQYLAKRGMTRQQEEIVFGVAMDGPATWASTSSTDDIQHLWNLETTTISDLLFSNDWLENSDTSPISPSPTLISPPYNTLLQRDSTDVSQSSVSDLDIQPIPIGTQKARRQAQNRAAQRAYRARKEEQLEKSRLRIIELEKEVQRLQKALGSDSTIQGSGSSNVSLLQSKITALETRNKTLETDYRELKERLRRTASMLLEPGSNT